MKYLILAILLFGLQVDLSGQTIVNGYIEHFSSGSFVIIDPIQRDTISKGVIRDHSFIAQIERKIPSNRVLPAFVLCVKDDHSHSLSAPLAIEHKSIHVAIGNNGVTYSGTPDQDKLSQLISNILEMEQKYFVEDSLFRSDSAQFHLGKVIDSTITISKNHKLFDLWNVIVADILFRKLVGPEHIPSVMKLCESRDVLSETEKLLCRAVDMSHYEWAGKPLGRLVVYDQEEREVSIDTLMRGKPYLLDFWATWCGPCIQDFPKLQELSAKYGIDIVGISIDSRKQAWTGFSERQPIPWRNYWDKYAAAKDQLNVTAVPTKLIIDEHGMIMARNPDDLENAIKDIMGN